MSFPILRKIRYLCSTCGNFDLCEQCEAKRSENPGFSHPWNHLFLHISIPFDPQFTKLIPNGPVIYLADEFKVPILEIKFIIHTCSFNLEQKSNRRIKATTTTTITITITPFRVLRKKIPLKFPFEK